MPKKTTKNVAHSGIQGLQNECKVILQKLSAAHQDCVKNAEKAVAKIKAQWVKADQAMKKAKAQKAALKAKSTGKKTAAQKKQADKLTMAFAQAKTVVQSLKKELSVVLPELKAAKTALKQHLAVEKVAMKKIGTAKKTTAKNTRATKAKSKVAKSVTKARRSTKKIQPVAVVEEVA